MSEHVPAWKRIGLKVKEELESDPLALTTHLDSGKVTKKEIKELNKRKRAQESGDKTQKKPPKRQKVPKAERGPPPEKDQLVYLKSYTTDKENWKFSKQKQNWILKHVKVIDNQYEPYLLEYFAGLQGGSKDRMVEILRGVIDTWNNMQQEDVKKDDDDEEEEEAKGGAEEKKDEVSSGSGDDETKKREEGGAGKKEKEKPKQKAVHDELTSVDADYAVRARKLLKEMIDEEFELTGIDGEEVGDKEEDERKEEKVEQDKPLDNLIIEQVEVSDFISDKDYKDDESTAKSSKQATETAEKSDKTAKKEKKSKKEKKKKKKQQHSDQ